MDELDKKLEKYVLNIYAATLLKDSLSSAAYKVVYSHIPLSLKEGEDLAESVEGFVGELKQAFIDDGWQKPNEFGQVSYSTIHKDGVTTIVPAKPGLMTKEQWELQTIKDGWRKLPKQSDVQSLVDEGLAEFMMTGQEWYDKFERLIYFYIPMVWANGKESHYVLEKEDMLKLAKKAVGIE